MAFDEIDLQWFASAEEEGRTEEPSEYKLRKAREEEGRVPKSTELTSSVVMLFCVVTLILIARWILAMCETVMQFYFSRCAVLDIARLSFAGVFFRFLIQMILPIGIVAGIAGIVANIVQNRGFIFTTKPITPDFTRIVPRIGQYLQKTVFSFEGAFNVVKSIVKIFVIVLVAFLFIYNDFEKLLSLLQSVAVRPACGVVARVAAKILVSSALVFLVISIPDYFVQRRQFMETMKMSRQEVKQEYKDMEGDPQVKGRLRQEQRRMMSRNIPKAVAESDVVITNPTHFAVALQYDEALSDAPQVSAKGADMLAQTIKRIARENDVPIVENRSLARGLYTETEIGDIIPEAYIRTIATIYAQIDYMSRKKK